MKKLSVFCACSMPRDRQTDRRSEYHKRSAAAVTGLQTALYYWEFHCDKNKIIIVPKVVRPAGCEHNRLSLTAFTFRNYSQHSHYCN